MSLEIGGFHEQPDWPKVGAVAPHCHMLYSRDSDSEVANQQ